MAYKAITSAAAAVFITAVQLFNPAAAQNGYNLQFPPAAAPLSSGLPSFDSNLRLTLSEDQQAAAIARHQYEEYGRRVQQYIADMEQRIAEAHIARGQVQRSRYQYARELKNQPLSAGERDYASRQLASLDAWLAGEKNMSAQAARNVQYCQQWMRSKRAALNEAEYNASEDQQAIADSQKRAADIAAEQRWQAQLAAGSAYYANGGYGLGYGFGPHYIGHGFGYGYGHLISHSSGGGHGSGGHFSGHVGGGHGGGGHR